VRILNNKDIAPTFQRATSRIALQSPYLLNQDELFIGRTRNSMQIGMISMQHLATGETGIARLGRRDTRIVSTGTKQSLSETVSKQSFADTLWACQQVGMAHLLR
jgi:hypothetical protein